MLAEKGLKFALVGALVLASLAPLSARGDAVDRLKPDYLKAFHAAIEGLKHDRQAVSLPSKFTDYRGAMHVHSGLSHDSRSHIDEIIAGAKKVGMKFLMFTEHPVPHHDYFKEGHRGLVDGVLLIPGAELIGLLAFPMSSVPEGSTRTAGAGRRRAENGRPGFPLPPGRADGLGFEGAHRQRDLQPACGLQG